MTVSTIFIIINFLKMAAECTEIKKNLSNSCNGFAEVLHKELYLANEKNIVSSPLCVHMILSLLSHGADSETLQGLTKGLQHTDQTSIKEGYSALINALNGLKDTKLYIANAMYVQNEVQLLKEFSTIGTDAYKSVISSLNFKDSNDAADKINSWVRGVTNEKISDIVSSDDLRDKVLLVLVNAIYFRGLWSRKFDIEETENRPFYTLKGERRMVATMFKKSEYKHGKIPELDATFLEIPYMSEEISMIITLPNEVGGLTTLQKNFSWKTLANAHGHKTEVELYLPRFKIEFMTDLEEILRKLGMGNMFEDKADFRRISDVPLKVSKVVHKAVIEVNEEGTEAAAAAAVQMRLRRMIMMPEEFRVDRPFMFVITHKPSNIPLFIGTVTDIEPATNRDEL